MVELKYRIEARIQRGKETIGYRLANPIEQLNLTKQQVFNMAEKGLIVNATYNQAKKSLSGIGNTDLRKLAVIDADNFIVSARKVSNTKTNHQLAEEYNAKAALIGREMQFIYLRNDAVIVDRVPNRRDTGRLVIPPFVSALKICGDRDITRSKVALWGCKFTEIFIDNRPDEPFYASGLCAYMKSTHIKVVFRHPECVVDTRNMFYMCDQVTSIDISNLATSRIQNMRAMFYGCYELKSLDISMINTSNVKDMSEMFTDCMSLSEIDLSNFDMTNVVDLACMLYDCHSLKKVTLPAMNLREAINLSGMFAGCTSLKYIDISKMHLYSALSLNSMFAGCEGLESITFSDKFDTSMVSNMGRMFSGCNSIKGLDLHTFRFKPGVDVDSMFGLCDKLERLNLGSCNINNLLNADRMFYGLDTKKIKIIHS